MNHPLRCLALATLLPIALAQAALAQAPTPGERWRSTTSMEAMGMKLPPTTTEVCSPKGAEDGPPPATNEDCQAVNERRTPKSYSFDMQCKDGTTGSMEMTQESPTKWSGKMVVNSEGRQMTMRTTSEKLPGECDASEMERRMNKMMAAGAAQQAKACLEGARAGNSEQFVGANASCKDKASVDAYCSNSRTMSGYSGLASRVRFATTGAGARSVSPSWRTALADTGKLCKFEPETVRKEYCSSAQAKREWKFLAEECPELAKPLAQRECAGRDFTTPVAPAFRDFCSAAAAAGRSGGSGAGGSGGGGAGAGGAAGGTGSGAASTGVVDATTPAAGQQDPNKPAGDQPQTPTDKAKEAVQRGREALKGLFGR
jgi:hypothetical protein